MNKYKDTTTDYTRTPDYKIPEIVLNPEFVKEAETKEEILPIEKISQLLMSFSSSASIAPTHTPRNFYEQLVVKDSGSVMKLWVWTQKSKSWKSSTLT